MRVFRDLLVLLVGAFGGCFAASRLLYGDIQALSFLPLIFALPGVLLVATSCGALEQCSGGRWLAYLVTIPLGAAFGAAVLTPICHADGKMVLVGMTYGGLVTLAWIIADIIVPRVRKKPALSLAFGDPA